MQRGTESSGAYRSMGPPEPLRSDSRDLDTGDLGNSSTPTPMDADPTGHPWSSIDSQKNQGKSLSTRLTSERSDLAKKLAGIQVTKLS